MSFKKISFKLINTFLIVFAVSAFLNAASVKNYFSPATTLGDNALHITGTLVLGTTTVTATAEDLNSIAIGIVPNSIFAMTSSSCTVISGKYFGVADNGKFRLGGTAVTSTAAELNILDGVSVSSSEINILYGATLSTAELNILTGVTATATEINLNDISAQSEVILATGAISNVKLITSLEAVSVATTTLAAPSAAILGKVKIIQMTIDNGDVELDLTNVQGQASGTKATFNSVNDTLILLAGTNKWNVLKEIGIVLS